MKKWAYAHLDFGSTWVKDRDPLPSETHVDNNPLMSLRIGDVWFNKKTFNVFILTDIKNKERIWEDAIPLLGKVKEEVTNEQ